MGFFLVAPETGILGVFVTLFATAGLCLGRRTSGGALLDPVLAGLLLSAEITLATSARRKLWHIHRLQWDFEAPLAQARACPSTERALNRFSGFLGPLFLVVLNAGLSVYDAFVDRKGGSFKSVILHSVHNNIVPHIATQCGLL